MKIYAVATALVLSLTPMFAQAGAPEVKVDKGFKSFGFNWGGSGSLEVVWQAKNIDGKLAVCGAYSSKGGSLADRFNKQALLETKIQIDGKSVASNIKSFKAIPSDRVKNGFEGLTAKCKVTKTNAPEDLGRVTLRPRSGKYKIDK